ncbi:MAG TPA: protein translocase subunit SecF [Armatimonadota bacterium]
MVDLFRYRHWDLVSKRGIYYAFSGLLLILGLVALFTHGLNQGIDFKGGGLVTYTVEGKFSDPQQVIKDIRQALEAAGQAKQDEGLTSAEVQVATAGEHDQVLVRTLLAKDVDNDALLAQQTKDTITPTVSAIVSKAGLQISPEPSHEVVTGTVSSELISQAIMALVLGSALIMLWIGIRYNIGGFGFRYSAGGIIALLHDLLILVGMFAIFRDVLQVNSPFIAALLTVLGYSIHDTIVIYDRIRENIRLRKGRTFAETVNISLLETMARSVNTVLTVLFTLLALFFFGGSTLRDFTAAMLIGVVVGAYSSIFIASQLLVSWSKGNDRIILPEGTVLTPAALGPQASRSQVASNNTMSAPSLAPPSSAEAIQRAREAGKTSKRRK